MKKLLLSLLLITASLATYSQTIYQTAADVCPLKVGMEIPDVELQNAQGELTSVRTLLSEKPTLLVFYRGSWCPYCNVHLAKLQEAEDKLIELGFQVVAISPDVPMNLQKAIEKNDLQYTLLSDNELKLTAAMGLAYRVSDATFTRYKERGLDLEEASGGNDHHGLPVPAAYLIDKEGLVHFNYVNPNYKTRIDPNVIMVAAESMVSDDD